MLAKKMLAVFLIVTFLPLSLHAGYDAGEHPAYITSFTNMLVSRAEAKTAASEKLDASAKLNASIDAASGLHTRTPGQKPIRLAQKSQEKKKAAPPPKKKAAPPPKKKAAPPPKKKAAPPAKKAAPPPKKKAAPPPRKAAPAPKKKAAPPPKKTAPAPKKTAPVQKEKAPPAKGKPQQGAPAASKKICAANPKYPGCDKITQQPNLGDSKEEGAGVGSVCEQNPQLPQCQQDQQGGAGNQTPPAPPPPPPPGGSGPTPPAPPAPPPPPPDGPSIQSSDVCPEGQALFDGQCFDAGDCPEGQKIYIPGGQCRVICPEGMVVSGMHACVIDQTCPDGQVYSGGQCIEEIGYEEYLSWCLAAVEQARAEQVEWPYGVVGATDEETCGNTIGQQCEEDYSDFNARTCQERPCPDGRDNVNGQCVVSCVEGSERVGAICQCSGGQVLQEGGVCAASCAEGTVLDRNGQCTSQCAGEFQTVLNGQCFPGPNCPRGYTRQENGVCVAPSSPPPGASPNAEGICANVNSDPLYDIYNGLCVLRRDAPYEVVLENCLAGRGIGDGLASVDQTTCEQLIVDNCKSNVDLGRNFLNQQMPRFCGDIANPADGEYVPPPTAGGEQPPAEDQQPPDTVTPPPPPDTETPPHPVPPPGTGTQPPPPPAPPGKVTKRPGVDTIPGYRKRIVASRPLAIVIANARYTSKVIKNAPHAAGGAAAFVKFLRRDLRLPASRILSRRDLHRREFVSLFGGSGGPAGRLKAILTRAPASEVIIYYSGRAMAVEGGRDAVLLPRDAKLSQPAGTGYRLSALYRALAGMGVRRLRLYLDTAFSTPSNAQPGPKSIAIKRVQSAPRIGPGGMFTPRNWVVISASKDNLPAYADPGRPRSAFTDALLGGLRGQADKSVEGNNDSAVTAGELDAFMRNELQRVVSKATGGTQRPGLSGPPSEILSAGPFASLTPPPAALPQSGAVRPSFNCAKAFSSTEKAICASPAIATLDNVMVGLYRKARASRKGAARNALAARQRAWLKQRNACGPDIACLAQRYGERIGKLQ